MENSGKGRSTVNTAPQYAEELHGVVDRVVFRNDDTGWTVIEVDTGEEIETAVGELPEIHVGEKLRLGGEWTEHPSFGRQFRVGRQVCPLFSICCFSTKRMPFCARNSEYFSIPSPAAILSAFSKPMP